MHPKKTEELSEPGEIFFFKKMKILACIISGVGNVKPIAVLVDERLRLFDCR